MFFVNSIQWYNVSCFLGSCAGSFDSLKKQEKELADTNGENKKKKRVEVLRRYRVSTFYQPNFTSSWVPAKILDGGHLGDNFYVLTIVW